MITYGSYSSIKRGSVGGLKDFYFTEATNHICTVRGNKWLKFDNVGVLSLSFDNGATYPNVLDLTGVCDNVTWSRIFANGNIGWASHTKRFYSSDNLATYHECSVKNIAGGTFIADTYDNFKGLEAQNRDIIVNGVEICVTGNYTGISLEVNAWYSIDSGVSWKSCFRVGTSLGGLFFNHFESIDYDPVNNVWWASIGDGGDSGWLKGIYNQSLDSWVWTKEKGYDTGNQWHTSGSFFSVNGNVYWASDSEAAYLGFWKAPIATMLDNATYTKIKTVTNALVMTYGNEQGVFITNQYYTDSVILSYNMGVDWELKTLAGAPDLSPLGYYNTCKGPDSNNWYRLEIQESTDNEPYIDSTKGKVLMMQIIPTAGSN